MHIEIWQSFCFLQPKRVFFWIWLLRVPIFKGPNSVCPFHELGPSFLSCVMHIMHFGTPKVLLNRLKRLFYVNGTLKYDKVFVFYSPKDFLFWIWLLGVPGFEGLKSVCPFHQHGPILWSGVLLVMHFGTPKSISLG